MTQVEGEELNYFSDSDDDDAISPTENKADKEVGNFEFTDNMGVMRLVRLVMYLQILSLIIDNPSISLPVIFHIVCRGLLYYSIRFYSRPFIDIVYVIEYFSNSISNLIHQNLPATPNKNTFHVTSSTSVPGQARRHLLAA